MAAPASTTPASPATGLAARIRALATNPAHSAWSWGCAVVVSAFFALAALANDRVVEATGATQGLAGMLVVALCAVVLLVLAERAFAFAFDRADAAASRVAEKSDPVPDAAPGTDAAPGADADAKPAPFLRAALAASWRRALAILCAWLPYFLVRFPGNLDPDTQWQILQTYGMAPASDHHPAFDTLLFGGVWHLGDLVGTHAVPLALYCLGQMAITALVLSLAVTFMRERLSTPPTACRVLTLFFALFPPIALFAQAMAKDMLFAWVWVLFLMAVADVAISRGRTLTPSRMVALAALLALLALTKKTGAYIFPLVFVVLAIRCRRLWWRAAVPAVVALAAFLAWGSIVLPALGIAKGPSGEMFSIPSQQVALYLRNYGDEMDDSDRETLLAVYDDLDAMAATYVPTRADATKLHWRESASAADRAAFLGWYARAALRHPATFVLAGAANDLPILWFDLSSEGEESLLFYLDNVAPADAEPKGHEVQLANWFGDYASYDEIVATFDGMFRAPAISRASAAFDGIYLHVANVLAPLFAKYAWVTLIPLACTAALLRRRARWAYPVLLAVLLQWGTLVVGPIPLPRYIVPFVYQAPLLVALALSPNLTGGHVRRQA